MHIVQEERTMSRPSAFKRNYSHCPLKKRPVQVFVKEEVSDRAHEDGSDDNSEPENLSTKPEDLSLGCKALTPPHGVALITAGVKEEVVSGTGVGGARPPALLHPLSHFLSKGAPLEPLSLNTPAPWQGYYPSHYLPPSSYYPYPEVYPSYYPGAEKAAPVAAYPRPSSPPQRRFAPLPQPRPVYVHYSPPHQHQEGVAPAFYSGPPPATPEDLSSPGSAASSSSTSSSPPPRRQRSKEVTPRYQCSFCSKSYSTYSGLSKHQQFHCSANEDSAAKKTFSCKHCDKVYVSLGALKMHIRTHTLPCKCRLCGKAFSRPWLLQGHIRTHTGEKPFTCPHCNRAFADRSNLRAHLQTHSDVKKYSCPTCSKTFSRMSLLSKHCEGGCPGLASPGEESVSSYRTEPLSPS